MKKILIVALIAFIALSGCPSTPPADYNAMGGIGDGGSIPEGGTLGGGSGSGLIDGMTPEEYFGNNWQSNNLDDQYCMNALVLYVGEWHGTYTKQATTENFYDASLNTYNTQASFSFAVDEHGNITGSGSGSISGSFGPDRGTSTYKETLLENPEFAFDISGRINCTEFDIDSSMTSETVPTNYYQYFDDDLGRTGSSRLQVSTYFYSLGESGNSVSLKVNPITLKAEKSVSEADYAYSLKIEAVE